MLLEVHPLCSSFTILRLVDLVCGSEAVGAALLVLTLAGAIKELIKAVSRISTNQSLNPILVHISASRSPRSLFKLIKDTALAAAAATTECQQKCH